jgi:hypothetical protein
MASISKVAISLVVVAVMIGTGFASLDVEGKSKTPGGGGGPYMYFKGKVATLDGVLAGIQIDLYYAWGNPTNPDHYTHESALTDINGDFQYTPVTVSTAQTYHLYAGARLADGYWAEHRICYLPAPFQSFLLKPDVLGYVYPFQAYGSTDHVREITLVKELTETYTVRSSLARGNVETDPLAYFDQYHYDFTESASLGSGHSGSPNLVCRIPFYFSGQIRTITTGNAVIEGYYVAKRLAGAVPEWGNFLNDRAPVFGTQTNMIAPGYGISAYRSEAILTNTAGASFTHNYGPNRVAQTIWLGMEITHSSPKADSVFWRVLNLDTVSHRYTYWYDGDVIHIWMSA